MKSANFFWLIVSQNSCPPIGAFGKISQIYEIVKTFRGDLVSKLPFLTVALTSAGKFHNIPSITKVKDMTVYVYLFSSIYYCLDWNTRYQFVHQFWIISHFKSECCSKCNDLPEKSEIQLRLHRVQESLDLELYYF